MEPQEIPGYYYDPDKKKYFKVDKKAPPTAAYSTESVKRRRLEHEQAKKALHVETHRKKLVRRSRALQDLLLGGLLTRELGLPRSDLVVDGWCRGLCSKGSIPLKRTQNFGNASAGHLYVGRGYEEGEDGVVIGAVGVGLYGTILHRDENDRVVKNTTAPFWMQDGQQLAVCPQISSLRYHQPHNKILLTSRLPGETGGLYSVTFTSIDRWPQLPRHTTPQDWDLRHSQLTHLHRWPRDGRVANTSAPAPAANRNLFCVVGTSKGLGCYSSTGQLHWIEDISSSNAPNPKARTGRPPPLDILSLDFLPSNPNTVVAGLRGSARRICLADLRQKPQDWDGLVHRSTPAYVRCLSDTHVLAAGPNHSMCIYDLRFRHHNRDRNCSVVTFPEYRNAEQIHLALDVEPSLGVVATSNLGSLWRDGRAGVDVFSLQTGKRLEVPSLRDAPSDGRLPPKALVFQTLPGETNTSLFVSRPRGLVDKFSFGGDIDEWTGRRFLPSGS